MNTHSVLMVDPKYFTVEYAINPYMKSTGGGLHQINKELAIQQWRQLLDKFVELGLRVYILEGREQLPDMVFAANQSFPFLHPKTKEPTVIMSQMKSKYRQPEVKYFEQWFIQQGYRVEHLSDPHISFEGNGDAILQPEKNTLWAGYGVRTDILVYEEIHQKFGFEIKTLKMNHQEYYHLDTCFSVLDKDTVAILPEAFSRDDVKKIEDGFSRVVTIEPDENFKFFAANSFSVDGKNIVLQRGSKKFVKKLLDLGFAVHEVETTEFIKSGGSVFCLKMALPT